MRKKVPAVAGRGGPAGPPAVGRGSWWQPIVLALLVTLTYSNSLSGPFILDDQSAIVQNATIRDVSRLDRVFRPGANSPESGRPIVNLSFALNYAAGGLSVRGYHLWNIAMHFACALLMFGIVRRTMELPAFRASEASPETLAFAASALWAVHPLNSEVVNYVTQRTESMMAAFLLLTLYASIRASESRATSWQVIAVVSCSLGMGCKESMVTAPVLVVLYDRIYLFGSWREALDRRSRLYVGLFATWLVLGGLMLTSPRAAVSGFSSGISVWTYLLNQAVMIIEYLRLTIWPSSLVVFYGWPLQLSLGDVVLQGAIVVALLDATALALVRAPRLGYLGAWFFITLAPTSSIVAVATEVGAERRMYVPLMALAVVAVVGGYVLVRRITSASILAGRPTQGRSPWLVFAIALVAVVAALTTATFVRNREYSSPLTLARTVVERRPTGIAHHILGEQLLLAGREEEAVTHLRESVARGDSRAGFQLGVALFNLGKREEARERLEAFVETAGKPLVPRWLEPPATDVITARAAIADLLLGEQRWSDASTLARRVLEQVPSHAGARRTLAAALFSQQQWHGAIEEYRNYLRMNPGDTQALLNLGVSLVATGDIDGAVTAFQRAVDGDPTNANARRLLQLARTDQAASGAAQR